MKPIWKAVLSSEVTKAGISTRSGSVFWLRRIARQLGQLGEERQVGLARLLEHEALASARRPRSSACVER